MDAMSVRMPLSLRKAVKECAKADEVSVNQYLITAAAEKVSAQKTAEFIRARIDRGARVDIERLLAKVPDVEPAENDNLRYPR
jgi:hypothetical protein